MALEDIKKLRLEKREALYKQGDNPYPLLVNRTHTVQQVRDSFDELSQSENEVALVGRVRSLREHGALSFGVVQDGTGSLQIAFKKDSMGQVLYKEMLESLDIGDFVAVKGVVFVTNKGEQTLNVRTASIITKSVRPLPEKWHGLKNVEERYRRRYLDLLMSENIQNIMKVRQGVVKYIREFYLDKNFNEVETPILQTLAGGASARPFTTHFNAFDMEMHLRIAPELYLKRLLVGGYEKVFEIGRNFRNEGVDYSHNPEFTMLESYEAYSDYKQGMKFTEQLIKFVVEGVLQSTKHTFEEKEIDFGAEWQRIEFNEMLMKYADVDYNDYTAESLRKKAEKLGVSIEKKVCSKAEVADAIYKKYCRDKLVQPSFIIHHPKEMIPLAKPLSKNPEYVGSFQLVIAGWELAKGYSELNDPVLQEQAFAEQQELKEQGDVEAQSMDTDFIEALEYGMPPAFGLGIGVDRISAFLAGAHALREIILFPTMKPKE